MDAGAFRNPCHWVALLVAIAVGTEWQILSPEPPCKPVDRPAASSSTLVGEDPTETFTHDDGCHAAWNTPT